MKALGIVILVAIILVFSGFLPAHAQETWLKAHAAIVIDAATGTEILGKNADTIMYPASTTKIMTALLAVEHGDLEETVKIGQEVNMIAWDSSRAHLQPGDRISLRDLLYGMMLASGNDAAYAVAVHIGRGASDAGLSETRALEEFIRMMNERARDLGAANTVFANPDGYPHPRHYTTARDLALIMAEAMTNPEFREIVQTPSYRPQTWQGMVRTWNNGNYLIRPDSGYYYEKASGGKTGYTVPAGFTMVATAREKGLELVAVALNTDADGRWLDTINLLEYGFREYAPAPGAAEVKFAQVPVEAFAQESKQELGQGVHPWVEAMVNFLARHQGRFSLSQPLGLLPWYQAF